MGFKIFLLLLLVFIVVLLIKSIKVVRQSEVYIIERLGKFHKAADAGLTIIIPFIDTVRSIVSLKQQTMDVQPQEVITSDNVTITIDTVVFYKVVDPAKAVYEYLLSKVSSSSFKPKFCSTSTTKSSYFEMTSK